MKLASLFFGFFISVSGCNASEYEKVQLFSEEVLNIVNAGDTEEFKQLPITSGNKISEEAVTYLFGRENQPGITGFLSGDRVKIKIYGPYGLGDARYSVAYYDTLRMTPNEKGLFNLPDIKQSWGVSYLETIVLVTEEGKVEFYRTPFYYGAHAPWEADH